MYYIYDFLKKENTYQIKKKKKKNKKKTRNVNGGQLKFSIGFFPLVILFDVEKTGNRMFRPST